MRVMVFLILMFEHDRIRFLRYGPLCIAVCIAFVCAESEKMAAENKLSDRQLKALQGKSQTKQRLISDGRGMSARVSKNGAVSFVMFYRLGGRDIPNMADSGQVSGYVIENGTR